MYDNLDRESDIRRLLGRNWDEKQIFTAVGLHSPEVFEEASVRDVVSQSQQVAYSPSAAEALREQIKSVKKAYEKEVARAAEIDKIVKAEGTEGVTTLADVEESYTLRIKSWPQIDRVFGC